MDALDGDPELTEISQFAAQLCDAPAAMVTIVEEERQRFLAKIGVDESETPRSASFCAAIRNPRKLQRIWNISQ